MMILINALLVVLAIGLTYGLNRTFSFMGNDVCYEPYQDVISEVDHVMSVTLCSVACAKDACCSFMYNAESQRCITSSGFPRNSTQGGCGWKYMVNQNKCIAPDPNTPFAPNTCDVGYSFNPAENKRVSSCDTYGTTFVISEEYNLSGFNTEIGHLNSSYSASTKKMSLNRCITATSFICRSVEMYHTSTRCHLSVETALTQPSSVIYRSDAVLFHRNCAYNISIN